jgi:hypothetical protein
LVEPAGETGEPSFTDVVALLLTGKYGLTIGQSGAADEAATSLPNTACVNAVRPRRKGRERSQARCILANSAAEVLPLENTIRRIVGYRSSSPVSKGNHLKQSGSKSPSNADPMRIQIRNTIIDTVHL